MNIPGRGVVSSLVVILILSGTFSCNIDQRESETVTQTDYFGIQPASIVKSITEGKKDVFTPISAEPKLTSSSPANPVSWDQPEYLQIAAALHKFVWGESLAGWYLYLMDFSVACDQADIGLQWGQFLFFKLVNNGSQETRIEHSLEIDPSRNFAKALEAQYYPNLASSKSIDLDKVKITAREALRIAESKGGYEKRLAVKNTCGISVSISPDSMAYDGWVVMYSPGVFLQKVDPVTGK